MATKSFNFSTAGAAPVPAMACAIYTRKSSEEGLEQDFNSLHAQREACEAFVLSQKSLGWSLNPTTYDDGGFSGGNVERPALKRLIADIEAGKIKVIVVYKVDRLTRSLADFAKLVELFDAKGVSFVSVTQQFNTTTSMGRLTLNVLLSFAQFEREVTGERIRDKIAASKRKGLWMGGVAPVGYVPHGRTLVLEEIHADRIRDIYKLYLEKNCVRKLSEELQQRKWLTPERASKRAGAGGNKPFSRGHLYRILSNPIYVGRVPHKDEAHPGQHPAIVSEELWNQVQQRLASNKQGTKTKAHAANPSLLAGKLQDELGRRLIPSHARKGNKRYRYYVTPVDEPGEALRLPANDLEELVIAAVIRWASDKKQVVDAVGWGDAKRASDAIETGKQLAQNLKLSARDHIGDSIHAVEVGPSTIRIAIDLMGCGLVKKEADHSTIEQPVLEVPAERKRAGLAVRLIIGEPGPGQIDARQHKGAKEPDPTMMAMLARARDWYERLTRGGQSLGDIADAEQISTKYVGRILQLALLAPDIVQALEQGEYPVELSATKLSRMVPLPMDWDEQRQLLGMA
ncbi:recombinase family protein [Hydrogenophaga sp. OTU3427]|uniref:recombinase family protein n=1 Tax=Hydrogenophaga sp. OTU3427 TaxID=3043856 RepID=UPI00313B9724